MQLTTRPLPHFARLVLMLPRVLRVVCSITIGLGAATISARALGQVNFQPSNPFLQFADYFPGRPASVLRGSPFACHAIYPYLSSIEKHCSFMPADGLFSSVDVTIDNNTIASITFILHEPSSVRVGQIELWWNTDAVRPYPNHVFFFLPEAVMIARTTHYNNGHSPLFSPVWSVSISDNDALH